MSSPITPDILIDDLRRQITERRVVVIIGAGVAVATTANEPASYWTGLLLTGVARCEAVVPGLPEGWADRVRSEIQSGDMDDLLSAAEKISSKLSTQGGEYGRWLRETVGALYPKDPSVVNALKTLDAPLLTTNYDSLIEAVTGWPTVTWNRTEDVEYVIRGEAKGILHLHGHWQDPQSVVLGLRSYEGILRSQHAQTMLQALRSTHTFLFVGYGEGLHDPNFSTLLRWARQVFSSSPIRHYRLALRKDTVATQAKHDPADRIYVLPYGEQHTALSGFLRSLGGAGFSPSPPPPTTNIPHDLAEQLKAWFCAVGYNFENHERRVWEYFEWIINQPTGLGFLRILVRGIEGVIERRHVVDMRTAIEKNKTDGGWLVTFRRVDPGARDEEGNSRKKAALFCFTFDELLDRHANFTMYLNGLERHIKHLGVNKYYVPLACLKQEFDPQTGRVVGEARFDANNGWIDRYIDQWLDDPSKGHISILGEFGSGKTWFALHYALLALRRYKKARQEGRKRPRLPLLISLRDYVKAASLESLLSEFFFRKYEIQLPGYSAFELLNSMGTFLLIFDGFDEMASRVDHQRLIDNFFEIARVAVPGAKVILTCRTEHFPDDSEVRELLCSQSVRFEVLKLDRFNDDQIRRVLSQRANSTAVDTIMNKSELLDLVRRPIMTNFVVEALPDVEANHPIDVARMYLFAIRRKMERDIKQERTFTSLADKLYFLCELSWEMLLTNRMSLNYRSFPELLRRLFGNIVRDQKDLDHWHHNMVGQTLLVRNTEGDYGPAHKSLAEFFAAYKLVAQLGVLAPDFLELATPQSHLADGPARPYTWSEYFKREFDENGNVKRIAPLMQFVPDESVSDLPVNQEPAGRRLSYNTLRFAAAMVARDPAALQRLCQLCWTTKDSLAWNSQELLPFLREEHAAELAQMLVEQSGGAPLPLGIPWVLGELGVASDTVCKALLNTVDAFACGGPVDPNVWWHSAFALRKLGRVGNDKERDETGPIEFLAERRPNGCTLENALDNVKYAVSAADLPDARISECDVVTIAAYAHSESLNAQELYNDVFSKVDFGSDTVRLRCYYLVWLCGHLKINNSLGALVRATRHVRGPVRNCAANALGRIGVKTPEVVAALEEGLRDHYYRARFHSAWSLWNIRATESHHALSDAIVVEEVSTVREAMLQVKQLLGNAAK